MYVYVCVCVCVYVCIYTLITIADPSFKPKTDIY